MSDGEAGAPPPVIDVQGVTKAFGAKTVVDHIDMCVRAGEIYGFLGPNGSGKTTFLRMLCGLLTPDEGTGTCLGFDIRRESLSIKREVGYMTQRFSHYEDLSIRENLDFVARLYGIPKRRAAVDQTLEQLGLVERQRQLAGQLSGGWKQRLALAACLLHQPKLLLLDEPTAGVDPKARRDFWEQIHGLAAKGLTVMITTHYMDEAERCHRLAYIARGRLMTRGTVEEVIERAALATFEVRAGNRPELIARLRSAPAIAQVVPFGNSLHVSGPDRRAIEAVLAEQVGSDSAWKQIDSSLEDVFISLMTEAERAPR
ncbi:ABC transporter ATP-binding protein [Engelhardtia mirabilis]|uniref:Putative ABC transporter ATP-binding protein YbhF n=1 Tax=Engelhardtia mirabilis TaxID=2528011 RepID=A0A518BM54_9BACT|nr:putative ABC transporter ATP-binding protein YbhF [Planctomycetes bacterium Pla133]QDV02369.1 putative ABC transporter ATP-binding protein YbhF [Planctomycetes bacterium Pla86]